jgi:hypothetical protein
VVSLIREEWIRGGMRPVVHHSSTAGLKPIRVDNRDASAARGVPLGVARKPPSLGGSLSMLMDRAGGLMTSTNGRAQVRRQGQRWPGVPKGIAKEH